MLLKRLFQKASRPRGDPPVRGPIYGEALRLGSDCAGLGTDFLALQMLQVPTTTLNLIWLSFDPFDCFSLIAHLILFDPF